MPVPSNVDSMPVPSNIDGMPAPENLDGIPDYSVSSPDGMPAAPGMPLDGMPNYGQPGVEAAPPEKPFEEMTLAERAESSFKEGRETEGFRWLYAHALAGELDEAGETLDKLRWIPGPKRPSLATRFGVAVKFDSPVPLLALAAAMPAIGDPVPGLLRGREAQTPTGAEAPGAESGRPKGIPTTAPATLRFFAGDLGKTFLESFEARRAEKDWGVVLSELEGGGSLVANVAGANDPYAMEGYGMPSPAASSEAGSNGAGASGSDRDRKKAAPELDLQGGRQISPGIVWLGFETSSSSAVRTAAPLGVDCVLLVDVDIQIGRNAPPRNRTKLTATDVASGKVVASETLDQFDVYEMRELRPNAPDPVEKAIERIFEKLAPVYTMQAMPEIPAESALNRARQLIADPPADPLTALAEMRYYLHKGLMDDAQYAIACKNLAGDASVGEKLASQKEEDRVAAVETLLKSLGGDEEASSEGSEAAPKSDAEEAEAEEAVKEEPVAEGSPAAPTEDAPVAP